MSDTPSKAVFLSYASQDAEAARRIADALRAAGIEVWFDQNELVGGDAWDAKIRNQIKACALFVPVISARTQARREGYFRIEWKLAAQRTHAFADGTPFLLPVVIDTTRDGDALVPEEFRAVQWTRLPGGETPVAFHARVNKLLGGEGAPVSDRRSEAGSKPGTGRRPALPRWAWPAGIALAVLALATALVVTRPPSASPNPKLETQNAKPAAPAAPLSKARELASRAWALSVEKYDSTADDFAAAESLMKQALELDQNDAQIWAWSSSLNFSFESRGFDRDPKRISAARSQAERALTLDPDSLDGLYALGRWQRGNDDPAVAEATFKKILARDPNHAGAIGSLARICEATDRVDEAVALYERAAALPEPEEAHHRGAALSRYTEFLVFFPRARFEEADRCIRQSIEAQVSANSQAMFALLLLTWKGDADGAARVLASGPTASRNEPRTIWSTAMVQLCQRAPEAVLKTLDRFSDDYIQDNWFSGPKDYFAGRAHFLAGRKEAARLAWEAGLAVVDARLKTAPKSWGLHLNRGELLAWLGQTDEALREARTVPELMRADRDLIWFASPARIYAALGRADDALPLLEKLRGTPVGKNVGWPLTAALLRVDPLWDKLRGDPRFEALCAESSAGEAKPPAPLTEAGKLAARALALYEKVGFTRDDLAPAEDFARRATELESDSATAWGVRAGVQAAWIFRNWDQSEKRRQDAQAFANRALALDPNEPEALLALGQVLRKQGASAQAEAHLRRAVAAHPNHVRLARALGFTLMMDGRAVEGRAVLSEIARRAPRDPLVRYELAMSYADYGPTGAKPEDLAAALEQLDAAIALQPFGSALLLKAALLGGWRGDLPSMRAALNQTETLPLAERAEDRAVCIAMWAGLLEHRPDRVEAVAALTARNYFDDALMPLRPKAWSLALAHRSAGKENLARADWQSAESVLRQRLKNDPANIYHQAELAITLAWLGQRDEAARLMGQLEPLWKEAPAFNSAHLLALYYAALGDGGKAMPYLARQIDGNVFTARKAMQLDPSWDKLRGQPEFEALLKSKVPEPKK